MNQPLLSAFDAARLAHTRGQLLPQRTFDAISVGSFSRPFALPDMEWVKAYQ